MYAEERQAERINASRHNGEKLINLQTLCWLKIVFKKRKISNKHDKTHKEFVC